MKKIDAKQTSSIERTLASGCSYSSNMVITSGKVHLSIALIKTKPKMKTSIITFKTFNYRSHETTKVDLNNYITSLRPLNQSLF